MDNANRVYRLKVGSSGRLLLPIKARERHQIANGDTVVVLDGVDGIVSASGRSTK